MNRWIPHQPTEKQAEFLACQNREVLYGGAAGGGKSDALLMAALQFVDVPGYAALLFRRTYKDLSLPEAIMDRSQTWLRGTDARWNDVKKRWTFPSGATLTFGNLDSEADKYQYQGAAAQFIGFDELTQFSQTQYRYLFSRLRRLEGMPVPLRMRSATNPGGSGHEWVKQRFIVEGPHKGRTFIPSRLADNPHLDRETYIESLGELDPATREQLLNGDWDAKPPGTHFRREWFPIVEDYPRDARLVRYWDLAATEESEGDDPDWTAGALVAMKDGRFWIVDVRRTRSTPGDVETLVKQTAELDGRDVTVWMEQEPGSSGKNTIAGYAQRVLVGFDFHGLKTTGPKETRARPLSAAAQAGNVMLVRGRWINDFLDEIEDFPGGTHDDQVDAASGAHQQLALMVDGYGVYEYARQQAAQVNVSTPTPWIINQYPQR